MPGVHGVHRNPRPGRGRGRRTPGGAPVRGGTPRHAAPRPHRRPTGGAPGSPRRARALRAGLRRASAAPLARSPARGHPIPSAARPRNGRGSRRAASDPGRVGRHRRGSGTPRSPTLRRAPGTGVLRRADLRPRQGPAPAGGRGPGAMTQRRIFLVPLRGAAPVEREVEHWETVHAPLFARTPGLLGYVQYRPLPEERHRGVHLVCSETTFADRDAERAAYASDFYREVVTPDEAGFLERDEAWSARLSVAAPRWQPGDYAVLLLGGASPGPDWASLEVSRELPEGG